jgi:hypothetical protein
MDPDGLKKGNRGILDVKIQRLITEMMDSKTTTRLSYVPKICMKSWDLKRRLWKNHIYKASTQAEDFDGVGVGAGARAMIEEEEEEGMVERRDASGMEMIVHSILRNTMRPLRTLRRLQTSSLSIPFIIKTHISSRPLHMASRRRHMPLIATNNIDPAITQTITLSPLRRLPDIRNTRSHSNNRINNLHSISRRQAHISILPSFPACDRRSNNTRHRHRSKPTLH